jgi:excinuclease UvrABC ATPase subunit
MAYSKCIKCDSTFFEVREAEPRGSNFKMMFIQCASCGGVVGVADYFNTYAILEKLASKLGVQL